MTEKTNPADTLTRYERIDQELLVERLERYVNQGPKISPVEYGSSRAFVTLWRETTPAQHENEREMRRLCKQAQLDYDEEMGGMNQFWAEASRSVVERRRALAAIKLFAAAEFNPTLLRRAAWDVCKTQAFFVPPDWRIRYKAQTTAVWEYRQIVHQILWRYFELLTGGQS